MRDYLRDLQGFCKGNLRGILAVAAQLSSGQSHRCVFACGFISWICVGSVEVAEFLRGCSDLYDVESETGFFKSLGASVVTAKQNME